MSKRGTERAYRASGAHEEHGGMNIGAASRMGSALAFLRLGCEKESGCSSQPGPGVNSLLTEEGVPRCSNHALSASPLSHAESPCGLAFLRYPAFSCGVQRNSTRAVAGFLTGGLPRGRLGLSMPDIVPVQIILDKPSDGVYSVRTLNTEEHMDRLPDNGNADIENCAWMVNMMEADDETGFLVTVQALSEQGAIIVGEEKYGEDGCYAISAYPKPHHTPRCPICASTNCRRPNCGEF